MKQSRYLLPMLALGVFPSTAFANAGTPLMWASALHLVFGNAIIGIIEGSLLAGMFKCSKWKSVVVLIVANYASAWVGAYFVAGYLPSLVEMTILNVQYWFLTFVAIAFVVTLLVEFPFFWFMLRSQKRCFRRSIMATCVIHSISYVALFVWYWLASGTSMMTNLEVVAVEDMQVSESFALHYISPEGDQVLRMSLNDSGSVKPVAAVAAFDGNDRLFVRRRDDSGYDLYVFLDSEDREARSESMVLEDFSAQAPIDWRISEGHSEAPEGTWFNFGEVPAVVDKSDWVFYTGFWPIEGLRGSNEETGESVHFSLELPFVAWSVRNATQIAGDFVVAQVGDDQLCLIHPASKRITLIARGRGPIVSMSK